MNMHINAATAINYNGWNRMGGSPQKGNPFSASGDMHKTAGLTRPQPVKAVQEAKISTQGVSTQGGAWGQNTNITRTNMTGNIMEESLSYGDTIRASRTKARDTALQLKKLQYDFKSISTQIMRSKTSANARQVAGRARREVIRLKLRRPDGVYDPEELQVAITHAQAIERVARKKVKHLEEEELVKVIGGPCAGSARETYRESEAAGGNVQQSLDESEYADSQDQPPVLQEEIHQTMEVQMHAAMRQEQSLIMDEMTEAMEELLAQSCLEELSDAMFETVETEMDPADYDRMKQKHRADEMKAIVKADAEYLKGIFDILQRERNGAAGGDFTVTNSISVTTVAIGDIPFAT